MAPKKPEKKEAKATVKPIVPGTKSYRLTMPHYRGGKYLERGEYITVTDEVASPTWVPVTKVPPKAKHTTLPKLEAAKKVAVEDDFDAPDTDVGEEIEGVEDDEAEAPAEE